MRTTTEYFNLSNQELSEIKFDDWTKEDCLLCDECIDAHPFCDDLERAEDKAEYYYSIGCEIVEILQKINGGYAVVAY